LGVARVIAQRRYGIESATRELARILGDASYASRAAEVGAKIAREDGVGRACDEIERSLSSS
jgi:hypothetical protein